MKRNVIGVSLNPLQKDALDALMREDMSMNMSAYIGGLIAAEAKRRHDVKNKRGPGRPSNKDESEELPDENEPRTMRVPGHLADMVLPLERGKLVNAYDILLLEEKKSLHEAANR